MTKGVNKALDCICLADNAEFATMRGTGKEYGLNDVATYTKDDFSTILPELVLEVLSRGWGVWW